MPAEVKVEQIKKAINMSIPLTIKTYTLPHDTEIYIDQVLEEFLKEIGHVDIYNAISSVVKELSVNAKKANTKRVYFTDENLDIDNGNDYESGMKDFKEKTLGNINHYLKLQKEAKLYIKVIFKAQDQELIVAIHNNVLITQKEQMRAYDRIARSRAFKSMEEAFGAVVDMSEGAGLGIVIMVLMLKKIGLSEEAFELDVVNGETIAQVAIPFSEIHIEKVNLLAEAVVKEVNTLPQFPENLVYLQKLISDPEDDIQDIARQVATDAALVGDLLKLVNSAMYMLPRKVSRIADAVKLVGMRGLRNLLFSHGSQRILEKKYSEMETLWHHCETVALYANFLAKTYRQKANVLEDETGNMHACVTDLVCSLLSPSCYLGRPLLLARARLVNSKHYFAKNLLHFQVQ